MERTSLCLLVLVSMVIVSAEGVDVQRVSLTFSPDRAQFLILESVVLSCEDRLSDSTVWRVKRTDIRNRTSQCGDTDGGNWGKMINTGCRVKTMQPLLDTGVYWCESPEGKSDSVQLTVTDGDVILGMPVLPVMEGSDVTLHCLSKDKTTGKPSSERPAGFYKDGSLLSTESTGQITIHTVHKSDEGLYKCLISGRGESPESRMDVRDNDQPAPPPLPPSLPPYVYPVMLSGVSMVLLILCLCLWKKRTDLCCVRRVQSQGTNQGSSAVQMTNQSAAPDDVYDTLQHVYTSDYEQLPQSHDYENVPNTSRRQHAADPVYSNVRNQE